jgi:glycosyltransferase involved in cell wall biosynthesis
MKPITFCIATAKNEREYIQLLLRSLKDNTNIEQHEILVFIDSDNQDTYAMLKNMKESLPNMRVCRNPNPYPIGGQRNVSIMFNESVNDVVCYLQSDMVVGKDFDKHISNNIKKGRVLACTRIEPPLHPASPEKVVKDFGTTPQEFQYENFNKYVSELQAENRPNIDGHFAPFATYKDDWLGKLGSFDTQFRCSREDSDTIIRMKLCGLETVQNWNACVYHFTCVSSRGGDWYKQTPEAMYQNTLQAEADAQELKRFIRKWGFFGHHPRPVYDITFDIELDRYANFDLLKAIEPHCSRMYLSNPKVAQQLAHQLEFDAHYYSNLRWNYTDEYWEKVKHLFNPTNFSERISYSEHKIGDVVIQMKLSDLLAQWNDVRIFMENVQQIVDSNDVGFYDGGFCTINIKQKNNRMRTYAKHYDVELLLTDQKFDFI